MTRANDERVGRPFPPGLLYRWQVGGQGKVRGSWSSGPVSPWCSTAYASWTGWWCHRVSVEVLGGNWLQLLAASRWGGGSPPGSSRLQDTETPKKRVLVILGLNWSHAQYTSGELKALFQRYSVYTVTKKSAQWIWMQWWDIERFIYSPPMVCLH